jgi:hypothetical protein
MKLSHDHFDRTPFDELNIQKCRVACQGKLATRDGSIGFMRSGNDKTRTSSVQASAITCNNFPDEHSPSAPLSTSNSFPTPFRPAKSLGRQQKKDPVHPHISGMEFNCHRRGTQKPTPTASKKQDVPMTMTAHGPPRKVASIPANRLPTGIKPRSRR